MDRKKKIKIIQINLLVIGLAILIFTYLNKSLEKTDEILSVDTKFMKPIKDIHFLNCDIFDPKTEEKISRFFPRKLDVIISDMAADTTGSKSLDSIRTNQLCSKVLELSSNLLKSDGVVVSKLFMGEDFGEVKSTAKESFKRINFFKPHASRKESKETYLHCSGLNTL